MIFAEYWIQCGSEGCDDSIPLGAGDFRRAWKQAEEWGWRQYKKGWTCPDCLEKLNPKATTLESETK